MSAVLSNPNITQSELSKMLGISVVLVSKNMAKLQTMSILRRIGGDEGGHWEIVNQAE